jgi:hypothetical protein
MMRSTYWLGEGAQPHFRKGGGPSRIRRRSHPTPCPSVGDSRPVVAKRRSFGTGAFAFGACV